MCVYIYIYIPKPIHHIAKALRTEGMADRHWTEVSQLVGSEARLVAYIVILLTMIITIMNYDNNNDYCYCAYY